MELGMQTVNFEKCEKIVISISLYILSILTAFYCVHLDSV